MRPPDAAAAVLFLVAGTTLSGSIAATAAAAPHVAQAQGPRAAAPTFAVAATGTMLTVLAQGPSAPFGADEELVLSKVADGYRVSMNGEGASARLVASSPCVGGGGAPATSVICPSTVTSARFDYRVLNDTTLTAVTTGIDVTFVGGSGSDEFYSSWGNDNLDGGPGDDVLFGDDEDGPYGNDTITGGVGRDIIDAFGGTNLVYAKDGIADTRVQCADPEIPGSSGKATWDQGLDKPINCEELGQVPDAPKDFKVSVGAWKGTGDNATVDLTFTWAKPTASQPDVDGYELTVFGVRPEMVEIPSGNVTSQVVTLSVRDVPPSIPGLPLTYRADLIALNTAGKGSAAAINFETRAGLSEPTEVQVALLNDARQGVRVSWKPGPSSPVAEVVGYRVDRKVPSALREGPEWLSLAVVDATTTFKVDPCLPPGIGVEYRVTPLFRVVPSDLYPSAPVEGPAATRSAFTPSFSQKPPEPTELRVDFNGIVTVNGRPVQVMLESKASGPQVDPGTCFGMSYDYRVTDKKTGASWRLEEHAMPRIINGAANTVYRSVYVSGTSAGNTLSFSLQSRWWLDAIWARDYGRGWNAPMVSLLVRTLQEVNAVSASIPSAYDVYASTTGASVKNLSVKRDGSGYNYRVSWTPPAASDPNAANTRGYEVCHYAMTGSNYSGLATNPNFPSYTARMRCQVVSAGTNQATIEQASWCPSAGACALSAGRFFVQVRPWVGVQKPEPTGSTGTIWADWNRSTFIAARPSS